MSAQAALPASVASRYEAHDVIGMGAYALRVYHATAVDDGAEVALKQAKAIKDGVGVTMDTYRELKLLREMSLAPHPNIVPLREFVLPTSDNTSDMFTVFDYSEYDLTDIIKHHKQAQKNINMALIRHFMHQLLSALGHLHEHWIVHRDVKPQNCLVSRSGCLQLADFGLARSFRAPLRRIGDDGDVCTLWYRAPELLFGAKTYTRAIDIFSAGCIFAELIGTEAAFRATERANATFQDEQVKKLFSVLGFPTEAQLAAFKTLPHFSRISSWKAPSLRPNFATKLRISANSHEYDLITKMLEYDPAMRITAADALNHPFFTESREQLAGVDLKASGIVRRVVNSSSTLPNPLGGRIES